MKFDNRTVNTILVAILFIMLCSNYATYTNQITIKKCTKPKKTVRFSDDNEETKGLQPQKSIFLHNDSEAAYEPCYHRQQEQEQEVFPYDSLYEDNTLDLENPVPTNNSIYGQNNLLESFEIDNYNNPVKYQFRDEDDSSFEYKPSEAILNVDDNKFMGEGELSYNVEGFDSSSEYAPFSM